MATTRQIAANRRNAQHSTGPRTDEGKERSRENAVTHGLACEVVVPPGDIEVAHERAEYWRSSLKPIDRFDNYLVDQVCVSSVRIDRCQAHEQALRERAAARAALCWEEDRSLAAARLGRNLAADPEVVRFQLRQSPQGCRWLVARWTLLVQALRECGDWDAAQKSRALDLLGTAADLRGGPTPLDLPGVDLLAVAESELESLREKAGALAPLDAVDRESAEFGQPAEPEKMIVLVRRYEASAARQLRWALKQLKAPHPMQTSPSPAYERPPAVAPSRPAPDAAPSAGAERTRWLSGQDKPGKAEVSPVKSTHKANEPTARKPLATNRADGAPGRDRPESV